MQGITKNPKRVYSSKDTGGGGGGGISPADLLRITNLENNEYKVTYYEIISGTSGSIPVPTGATINTGEFGLSGNSILSKINGSNKPTFESPKTAGSVVVTASLNTVTGSWVTSGVYTDPFVALIYSIRIKAVDYVNLNYNNIIETVSIGNLITNTDDVSEGTTNLYFTTSRVLATTLTSLSLVTGTAIVAADSVLIAFGKLQKQINDIKAIYVTLTTTQSLTNKEIVTRVVTTTSTANATFNLATTDTFKLTAQAAALTIGVPTGTPKNGQLLVFEISNNGTANTITINPIFVFDTLDPAPPSTITGKAFIMAAEYYSDYLHYKVLGWRFV